MKTKFQVYREMAKQTATGLVLSHESWTSFLQSMARLYKYPYHEQLMIYAQRPDATACASYEIWNNQMRRYVQRGRRGIALIDTTGDNPEIKYVFDVSDTGVRPNSRTPYLFQFRPEHEQAVTDALADRFGIGPGNNLPDFIEEIANWLADDYWAKNKEDILRNIDGSYISDYDEENIRYAFHEAAVVGSTYTIMARCGLNPDARYDEPSFMTALTFNTPQSLAPLGTVISQTSEAVLRQIEVTVKKYEREKLSERSQNYEQPNLPSERRLPDPQPEPVRPEPAALGQVRQTEESLSEGTPPDPVEQHDPVRDPVPPSAGDRPDGEQPVGTDDAPADAGSGSDGSLESQRPDEVDRADEQPESPGGGNDSPGADLQLTQEALPETEEQFSFFATEAEQIAYIDQAESVVTAPSAFTMPQEYIDQFLLTGSNTDYARTRLAIEYSKQLPMDKMLDFIQKTYHGGYGLKFGETKVSAWYAEDGMHIAYGTGARYTRTAQILSWEDMCHRIGELLDQGRFATNVELAEMRSFERKELAEKLWYMDRDINHAENSKPYMSIVRDLRGGFPDDTAKLMVYLSEPESYKAIMEQLYEWRDAYKENPDIMRFRHYHPDRVVPFLEEYAYPRKEYVSDMAEVPEAHPFITEDEINELFTRVGHYSSAKDRLYDFYQSPHTPKEKQDYIKNIYGIGGGNCALSRNFHSDEWHDGKGIRLDKPGCTRIELNWRKVVKYYDSLMESGRYFTPEELAEKQVRDAEKAVKAAEETAQKDAEPAVNPPTEEPSIWNYNNIKNDHPNEIVLYQVGDFYEIYGEDAVEVAPMLDLTLSTKPVPGAGRTQMCGIPIKDLERFASQLQQKHSLIVASLEDGSREHSLEIRLAEPPSAEAPVISEPILAESVIAEQPAPILRTTATQAEIDAAIQAWNGDIASKRAVVRYMEQHDRERSTAAWLQLQYGSDTFYVGMGGNQQMPLSWPKVQRRIAQLIKAEKFYTEEEYDRMDDIDPVAIRERLDTYKDEDSPFVKQVMQDVEAITQEEATKEDPNRFSIRLLPYEGGITGIFDGTIKKYYGENGQLFRFAEQYNAIEFLNKMQHEHGLPEALIFTTQDGKVYRPGDQLAASFNGNPEVQLVIDHVDEDDVWYTMPSVLGQDAVSMERTLFERYMDKGNITSIEQAVPFSAPEAAEPSLSDEEFAREHLIPGETTFEIDSRTFLVDRVNLQFGSVNFQDITFQNATGFPIFRTEPISFVRKLIEEQEATAEITPEIPVSVEPEPNYTIKTGEYISGEKSGLPYDVVFQTIGTREPEPPAPVMEAQNFRITDDALGVGGAKAKFRMNMDAIHLLQTLEAENRQATPEEQAVLSRYVGWGGLADAFDESKAGWTEEYKELSAALTPQEYSAARSSTLNAHYTSPTVIKAMYDAISQMGFQTGNILEPSMGVGNFFGMLPEKMQNSRLYGVELDSITGRIAKQLYPKANITISGFEKTDRRDFFDLAVGNVPFGQYQVNDPAYNRLGFSIHNYFFAKAMDQLRPGGVMAFVTSRYTMDAKNSDVRKYLAERAQFLGAIRLPNDAFKANAGTEVVSDIIFLQKRDRPIAIEPDWVQTGENKDGYTVNRYFLDNPHMVLGEETSESTRFGQDYTVAPKDGISLAEQLQEAVKHIHGTYQEAELPDLGEGEEIDTSIPADPDVKNFSYTLVDGEVYYRENSRMVKPQLNATANPNLPDDPGSKVNMCVRNILRIWEDGKADKLTQLVFCDISTPKKSTTAKGKTLDSPEVHTLETLAEVPEEKEFTVYDDIRNKLIDAGVPAEQIAFIHDANTDARKKELFGKVRSGQVRVLMGSTFKMGAGMNVQDRLIALHDLDCPWRPGDLEQRSGRIIRQGNMNPEVHIYRYVTEGTFDSYLWQTVENKQKFISQIMTSKSPVRSCEDVDETALSYAEIKALCAGDPRIKEKMDLDIEVARLKLLKADHQSQQFRLEDNLLKFFPEQVEKYKGIIAGIENDMVILTEHPHPTDGFAGMTVKGDTLTDKDNAGAALLEACKEATGLDPVPIGTYRGFAITVTLENFGKDYYLQLKGNLSYSVKLGSDARGNLVRIENELAQLPLRLNGTKAQLQNTYTQMENAKAEIGKPFPQEAELRQKSDRLAELNILLDMDGKGKSQQVADGAIVAKSDRPSVLDKLKASPSHSSITKNQRKEIDPR